MGFFILPHPLIHAHTVSIANLKSVEAVRVFLGAWQSRYPHEKKDSLSVWNDVVTGRCMMMRKIMEKFTE